MIILLGYSILRGYSQEAPPVIIDPAPVATPASKKGVSFFKPTEFSKKQKKESRLQSKPILISLSSPIITAVIIDRFIGKQCINLKQFQQQGKVGRFAQKKIK